MVKMLNIQGRSVGSDHPCLIIAEAGVNHNGDPDRARRLIDVAAAAGADAVKFQTFKAERLASSAAPKAGYQIASTGTGESQLDMLRRLELPFEVFVDLSRYCREVGILFLSTPFDEESADFLAELDMPAFKMPSGEITNLPFLAHVAGKGIPVILSTGMSHLGEVESAVRAIEAAGNRDLILLHCVSNYPADPGDVNLRAMRTMEAAFGLLVGYSDHTMGDEVALAAVAMGACIIEKHFTLSRSLPGPDHQASLEPDELRLLVQRIRTVEAALGNGRKEPAASEMGTAAVARKSLVAASDIPAGAVLTEALIAVQRPGTGLPPSMRAALVGRSVRSQIAAGELLTLEMLA